VKAPGRGKREGGGVCARANGSRGLRVNCLNDAETGHGDDADCDGHSWLQRHSQGFVTGGTSDLRWEYADRERRGKLGCIGLCVSSLVKARQGGYIQVCYAWASRGCANAPTLDRRG